MRRVTLYTRGTIREYKLCMHPTQGEKTERCLSEQKDAREGKKELTMARLQCICKDTAYEGEDKGQAPEPRRGRGLRGHERQKA